MGCIEMAASSRSTDTASGYIPLHAAALRNRPTSPAPLKITGERHSARSRGSAADRTERLSALTRIRSLDGRACDQQAPAAPPPGEGPPPAASPGIVRLRMQVCVIGGTGHIGKNLVQMLLGEGHAVTVITTGRTPIPDGWESVNVIQSAYRRGDASGRRFCAIWRPRCWWISSAPMHRASMRR